jgi:hypothetical protein
MLSLCPVFILLALRNSSMLSIDTRRRPESRCQFSYSTLRPILIAGSRRDWLEPGPSRATAGLTAIDARIAGPAGLHQAAAGHTRRTVAHVIEEL